MQSQLVISCFQASIVTYYYTITGSEEPYVLPWLMQEKMVEGNYYLRQAAKEAYKSYLLAYNSHSMKDIFNVHRLNLQVPKLFLDIVKEIIYLLISAVVVGMSKYEM